MAKIDEQGTQTLLFHPETQGVFLNVVKDGKLLPLRVAQIFDSSAYEELLAITYVSSPAFFFRTTKDFKKITLILGIDDNQHLERFQDNNPLVLKELFQPAERLKWWKSLDSETRDHIRKNDYTVRYGKTGVRIHSKVYLMSGPVGTRVALGSPNLTRSAFSGKRQFEELLIFDDSPLYDLYRGRFNQILEHTDDYIPVRIKNAPKEILLSVNDPELLMDILLEDTVKTRLVIPEEEMAQIRSLPRQAIQQKQEEEALVKVIELMTQKVKNKPEYTIASKTQLNKKLSPLKTVLCCTSKQSAELDNRKPIHYNESNHLLVIEKGNEQEEPYQELVPLSVPADTSQIEHGLSVIEDFVDAYNLFTTTKSVGNQARVMEAILYGFLSPYIFKIRDHYAWDTGRENARSTFPPFLIIAGRSRTGKTTLLEFISFMLGSPGGYMSYPKVSKANIILDYFYSDNLFPILIDEFSDSFFRSKRPDLGEQLIKHVSNDCRGTHPVLVATTNATGFSVAHQSERRIYYLGIDNAFESRRKAESDQYLYQVMNRANAFLFQDFSHRVSQVLRQEQKFYELDDCLYLVRNIFREYYAECGRPIPPWFPTTPFQDYIDRGRLLWREIYEMHSRNNVFTVKGDKLNVDIDRIKTKPTDQRTLINYLPVECIKEDSQILILNRDEFFRYIGARRSPIKDAIMNWFAR